MKSKKTGPKPRRRPGQSRSNATVDSILEASAQILIREGQAKLNTNHIASVAGVSVGSIYQYFGNKETILAELGNRHIDEMMKVLTRQLKALPSLGLSEAIETIVTAVIDAHLAQPALHQVLVRELGKLEGYTRLEELEVSLMGLAESFLVSRSDELVVTDFKLSSFIVVQTIENLVHQGIAQKPPIDLIKLKQECTQMLYRYLSGRH